MSKKRGLCNSKSTLTPLGSPSTPQSGASYYPIYSLPLPMAPSSGALSYTWSLGSPWGVPSNRLDEHLSDRYGSNGYARTAYAQMVFLTYSGPVEKSQHSSKAVLSALIFSAITDSDFDRALIREMINTLVHPCDGLGVADSVFHALR